MQRHKPAVQSTLEEVMRKAHRSPQEKPSCWGLLQTLFALSRPPETEAAAHSSKDIRESCWLLAYIAVVTNGIADKSANPNAAADRGTTCGGIAQDALGRCLKPKQILYFHVQTPILA